MERNAKVFSAFAGSCITEVKAFFKKNAVKHFQELDPEIGEQDVKQVKRFNSHQAPVDDREGNYIRDLEF